MVENSRSKSWFDKKVAIERLRHYLSIGNSKVRIATGYFSINGWNLIRQAIGDKQVDLIVGIHEPDRKDVREVKQLIIQDLLQDLSTGRTENRRQVVKELIQKIKIGNLKVVDGRSFRHHAKLYIVDDRIAILGSANLSVSGLRNQVEAGIDISDSSEIDYLIERFKYYFDRSKSLTQELLNTLEKWLNYSEPWDAYLKFLLAFKDLNFNNKYLSPATYQVDIIAKTLKNIRQYRGTMLVASTGLGKTVIATHVAMQLNAKNEIENVFILCPKIVKKEWKLAFRKASIQCECITYNALDKENAELDFNLEEFIDISSDVNDKWMIIIDESHFFRNSKEKSSGFSRKSFDRLTSLVNNSDCKVLLLTGSPYSRSINNLNDQLLLLPFTNEGNGRWQVNSIQEYLDLPVVCQLTTPYVAKMYGQKEDKNLLIEFGSDKKYIPSVNLYKICVPLFLENDIIRLLQSDILIITDSTVSRDSIKREVQTSWVSSPAAISHALKKVIDTPTGKNSYDVDFLRSQEDRKTKILPLLEKIYRIEYRDDRKLLALVEIIKNSCLNNEKVIIFAERKVTIVYLQNALNELLPEVKVFSTINTKEDKYVHKADRCIEKAIKEFAPIANKQTKASIDTYDLFVSTDAYGVGINLQDAPVAINYDLSWTPIDPIQRAGRILRPWILPRIIKLYTFVPITDNDSVKKLGIIKRWGHLSDRHAESKTIIDLPVLPLQEEESINNLSDLASGITIESGKLNIDLLASEPVSTDLSQHASILHRNRSSARQLQNRIVSSKVYAGADNLICVLLKCRGEYKILAYTLDRKQKGINDDINISLTLMLDYLKCERNTSKAFIPVERIETLADKAITAWCLKNSINYNDEINIECLVYLVSESKRDEIDNLAF
jgi:superfamily II DNA or RNA helicase